jgi:hypothetical protein
VSKSGGSLLELLSCLRVFLWTVDRELYVGDRGYQVRLRHAQRILGDLSEIGRAADQDCRPSALVGQSELIA